VGEITVPTSSAAQGGEASTAHSTPAVKKRPFGSLVPRQLVSKSTVKSSLIVTDIYTSVESDLKEIRKAFRAYQSINRRDAVYLYLSKVFAVVTKWQRLKCPLKNARAALRRQANPPQMKADPFAIMIFCTSDPEIVDAKARSKWSRILRYAARTKPAGQRLSDFIKSDGGINECVRKTKARVTSSVLDKA
jgi:hypothetical protein